MTELGQVNGELEQRLMGSQKDREMIQGDLAQAREEVRRVTDAMTIES